MCCVQAVTAVPVLNMLRCAISLFHMCDATDFTTAACMELAQGDAVRTLCLQSFLFPKSWAAFLNLRKFRFVGFTAVSFGMEVDEITPNDTTILCTAILQELVSVCLPRSCLFLIFWRCKPASAQVSGYSQIDFRGSRIRCSLKITASYFFWTIVCLLGVNEIRFGIDESCVLLYASMGLSLYIFKRAITRWSHSCLVLLFCPVMFFSSG